MKIRRGFVSNSSSSSFVVWGMEVENIPLSDQYYLKIFNETLERYEDRRVNFPNSYGYVRQRHALMLGLATDDEKISFVKDNYGNDLEYLYGRGIFSTGNYNDAKIGISPENILKHFPDSRIGDINKIVANEINKEFGTNISEQDIHYIEEVWMN